MNKINIPSEFTIFGQTIKVVFKDNLIYEDDAKGMAKFRRNEIWLQSLENDRPIEQLEKTYLHEVIHWILHLLSLGDIGDDERIVDTLACAFHQVLKTSKYLENK